MGIIIVVGAVIVGGLIGALMGVMKVKYFQEERDE